MKVKILRNTLIAGEPVKVGDVVEVTETDGFYLRAIGKAVEVKDEPAATPDPDPDPQPVNEKPKKGKKAQAQE